MHVGGQYLSVDVQFDDGYVLLSGASIDVNQAQCFIKARQMQSFESVLSWKPRNRIYVQCNLLRIQ